MKKILHHFTSLILCFAMLPAWAQLPQKAEDICPSLIGEAIPKINLVNAEGSKMNLQNLMNKKPTVLIFYRGGWCPFCNQHLSALGEASEEVIKMGFQIIAISPDEPAKLKQTAEKEKLPYQLFSDSAGIFAQAVGIAFQAPAHYAKTIVQASGGSNKTMLPVPAVFVVDKQGIILYEHINPNYKSRMSSKLLLAVLQGLN